MVRFDPAEWPSGGVQEWREAFLDYWRGRRYPGGLFGLMAVLRTARRTATSGVVATNDDVQAEVARLEHGRRGFYPLPDFPGRNNDRRSE